MIPNRREFLGSALALPIAAVPAAPVIDTHTHFYDPTRPQGVPWPGKGDKVLYRPVLPAEYKKLVEPHGITGTVVVEASPIVEDNDWLLNLAKENPIIVGVVGRLHLDDKDFPAQLARYAKDKRFRGIRISHGDIKVALAENRTLERLKRLGDNGLSLDVNGGPNLLPDLAKLVEKLPKQKIVLNHLANVPIDGEEPPAEWSKGIAAVAGEKVWCKLSALVEATGKRNGTAPPQAEFYKPVFEVAWKAFGPDKLCFGSNWPVSDIAAPYKTLFAISKLLVAQKDGFDKVFGLNAVVAYGL